MFWKRKREERQKQRREELEFWKRQLKEFRDIGETFQYLGTEMVVVAHSAWWHGGPRLPSYRYPAIVAEYMTAEGIKQHEFIVPDLPILRRMNGEA